MTASRTVTESTVGNSHTAPSTSESRRGAARESWPTCAAWVAMIVVVAVTPTIPVCRTDHDSTRTEQCVPHPAAARRDIDHHRARSHDRVAPRSGGRTRLRRRRRRLHEGHHRGNPVHEIERKGASVAKLPEKAARRETDRADTRIRPPAGQRSSPTPCHERAPSTRHERTNARHGGRKGTPLPRSRANHGLAVTPGGIRARA